MKLKEIIYPNKCIICRTIIPSYTNHYICTQCDLGLVQENMCKICGKPYSLGDQVCIYCGEIPGDVTQIISLFPYTKAYKAAILRWKYYGVRKYAKSFAWLFNEVRLKDNLAKIDALIPVPIAPARYRKRGFNQAEDLAIELGKLTGIPVYNILKRTKSTKPQSACSKEERTKNIKGTIKIVDENNLFNVNNVAIIDDIYTTGSTIRECIKIIKTGQHSQLENIYIWTIGIGI